MRISLIDIDSKIPNLALKKIEKYHMDRGDKIDWNNPLMASVADKVYVSCVFSWNKNKCEEWNNGANNRLIGGSGYSLLVTLPREIDEIKPRINLGFTTRGCIRKCPFCIVPKKEGNIRIVGDLLDLWDGKAKDVIILDNNIFALPKHFKLICQQARENKIRIDFNQGLDCRLLTDEICKELKSISHIEYRFAFDDIRIKPQVDKAITLLQKNGISRNNWYVLVGFNTTFREDLERLNYLRSRNQNAYVQRYCYTSGNKFYIALARWVNQHAIFQGMSWEQFLNHPANKNYKAEIKSKLKEVK